LLFSLLFLSYSSKVSHIIKGKEKSKHIKPNISPKIPFVPVLLPLREMKEKEKAR